MADPGTDLRTIQDLKAVIESDPAPIPIKDFGEFFTLFRGAYAATLDSLVASGQSGGVEPLASFDRVVGVTRDHLENLTKGDINRLIERPLAVEPAILQIRRENPIELVLSGVLIAFAGAVILSGGEFRVPGVVVKLPPLGHGIERLRQALRRSPRRRG
jgi:hypothetical protein